MQEKHTPLPWRVGHWGGQCLNPDHVKARRHPGPPECVYEPYFSEGDGGIAGPEPNQMVVDTHYDGLVISDADAEFILRACNAHHELIEALKAATGYLLNAKIDLETGTTKATAIRTIEGGLTVVRAAIARAEGRS
jgi:hypothetical protein